jgi:hypothetical protein
MKMDDRLAAGVTRLPHAKFDPPDFDFVFLGGHRSDSNPGFEPLSEAAWRSRWRRAVVVGGRPGPAELGGHLPWSLGQDMPGLEQ